MKGYFCFASVLAAAIIGAWALCAKFLGTVINGLFPDIAHEEFVTYWFWGFVAAEALILIIVFYTAIRMGWIFRPHR